MALYMTMSVHIKLRHVICVHIITFYTDKIFNYNVYATYGQEYLNPPLQALMNNVQDYLSPPLYKHAHNCALLLLAV